MVTSEREMVKQQADLTEEERSTSLQPTYEDSVPSTEDDWEFEDE
jgi:hypothetical protein